MFCDVHFGFMRSSLKVMCDRLHRIGSSLDTGRKIDFLYIVEKDGS